MLRWVVDSKVNNILLVEVVDVDESEDALEHNCNNHEHTGGHKLSSGGVLVSCEEDNEEGTCNDDWDVQDEVDYWVVPGEVVVENQEEVIGEQHGGEHKSEHTDSSHTTLDWEATKAGLSISLNVGASAKAAAAWLQNVLWSLLGKFGQSFGLG